MPVGVPGLAGAVLGVAIVASAGAEDGYLSWPAERLKPIGLAMRAQGRVGGVFDLRVRGTDRSINYKLRATWLTPEVIRASARLHQLRNGLDESTTRQLVSEAESREGTVILVEIDPREGSGVIPLDWVSQFGPAGLDPESAGRVRGSIDAAATTKPGLAGVADRDYSYDRFWVRFPWRLSDGRLVLQPSDGVAELTVRIYSKVGRVSWPVPPSIRKVLSDLP